MAPTPSHRALAPLHGAIESSMRINSLQHCPLLTATFSTPQSGVIFFFQQHCLLLLVVPSTPHGGIGSPMARLHVALSTPRSGIANLCLLCPLCATKSGPILDVFLLAKGLRAVSMFLPERFPRRISQLGGKDGSSTAMGVVSGGVRLGLSGLALVH